MFRCSRLWLFICCKTKFKKNFFFFEKIFVFYKIYIICRKKHFYMEKKFYNENFFYWKKLFYRVKYKNVNVKNVKNIYLISEIYIITRKMFVFQIKYKSFLNILYSFCKNNFLIIKNIFVKTSSWIIWSLKFRKQPICGIP